MSASPDPFNARATLSAGGKDYAIWRLDALGADLSRTPYVVKILIENVLRNAGGEFVSEDDVKALTAWAPNSGTAREVPLLPARHGLLAAVPSPLAAGAGPGWLRL